MADENYQGREHRSSIRITFPSNRLPRIKINGKAYAVIDMSEKGIRFYNPFHQPIPDGPFTAQVAFQDGEQVKVVARAIRYEPLMVALTLVEGIPLQRILAEQALINEQRQS